MYNINFKFRIQSTCKSHLQLLSSVRMKRVDFRFHSRRNFHSKTRCMMDIDLLQGPSLLPSAVAEMQLNPSVSQNNAVHSFTVIILERTTFTCSSLLTTDTNIISKLFHLVSFSCTSAVVRTALKLDFLTKRTNAFTSLIAVSSAFSSSVFPGSPGPPGSVCFIAVDRQWKAHAGL
jgi:hypothetical protein